MHLIRFCEISVLQKKLRIRYLLCMAISSKSLTMYALQPGHANTIGCHKTEHWSQQPIPTLQYLPGKVSKVTLQRGTSCENYKIMYI